MNISKIFFDMDGVLADFDKGVQELCGIPAPDVNNPDKAARKIMWQKIKEVPNFYGKLEPMEEGIRLFNELYDIYGNKCEILTGIPKADKGIITAEDDKRAWCKRHLPEGVKVNVVYKEDKKNFCTGKDCILIDDLKANIDDWEKAGGTGVFYTGYKDAIKQLSTA